MPNPCTVCHIQHLRHSIPIGAKLLPQRKLDIHTELDIICKYCKGKSTLQLGQEYPVTFQTINNILRRYQIPLRTYSQAQRNIRGTKTPTFPLSTEIPHLAQNLNNQRFFPHLIAICLLTDGTAGYRKTGKPYITFTNKAQTLHQIFADLIHYKYRQPPSAYFEPYWSHPKHTGSKAYYTTYNRRQETEETLQDLFTLSPAYRTQPRRGQTWEDYLQEPSQPNLNFIFNIQIPKSILIFATRLAMSAEGTISPIFRKDSTKPFPHLIFGCQHPILLQQWKALFTKQGMEFKNRHGGLERAKIAIAAKFLSIGGFIPGVPVRKGSYYEGLTKQQVLQAIFLARQNTRIDPKIPIHKKHAIIRKYAETIQEAE